MTTSLMPEGRHKYFDSNGRPLAGGKVYTYAANTTTPKAAYTDSAGLVSHANPIILDAKGEATIFWDGAYKVDVKTSAGVSITGYPVDNFKSDPHGVVAFIASLAASAGSSLIGFIQSCLGAVARTLQSKAREVISIQDFGAIGDGSVETVAFNKAITYANSLLGNDRANVKGLTIELPDGRYALPVALNPITVSGIWFRGKSKDGAVLLLSAGTQTFTWGDSSLTRVVVGGGLSQCKIEYLAAPTSAARVADIDYAFGIEFCDLQLVNIGTLLRLGVSASRIAGDIVLRSISGSVNNGGRAFLELKYGAGLTVSDCRVFVAGVLAPVHPNPMTTVAGTHIFKCEVGFWDTMRVVNCIFERFDIGLEVTAAASMVYQNFYFTNTIFDYCRRWGVYMQASGGIISTFLFDPSFWANSWEEDAFRVIQTSGYNDGHKFSGTIALAGKYGFYYQVPNGENTLMQGLQFSGTNRVGGFSAAMYIQSLSRGFSILGCKGNSFTGSGWTRPDYGLVIGADCDEYQVSNCGFEGPVGDISAAANTGTSNERRIFNNVKAKYAGLVARTLPATTVRYTNTTPFVEEWLFFGGTITGGYDKNGAGLSVALPFVSFRLQPGDNFAVGYSVAPGIRVFVEP